MLKKLILPLKWEAIESNKADANYLSSVPLMPQFTE